MNLNVNVILSMMTCSAMTSTSAIFDQQRHLRTFHMPITSQQHRLRIGVFRFTARDASPKTSAERYRKNKTTNSNAQIQALRTLSVMSAMLGMVGASGTFGAVFFVTPELFPTNMITQATGLSSCSLHDRPGEEISDHTVGLQHPERVHPPSGSASARWHADLCEDPDWQNHHFGSGALRHY